MTLLSTLGFLAFLFGIFMIIMYPYINKESSKTLTKLLLFFNKKRASTLVFIGFFLFILNGMFFYAKPGTAYAVQYLWGGDEPIYTQGIKIKLWGRTIPISYEIPVQDVILDDDEPLTSDEDIYYRRASQWEFNDAIKAKIGTAIIVGIDVGNDEVFLNMADRNKTEEKLVYARVMPNIDAAIKNTCKLISAQDYIAGASADFDRYFRDQLENGMYQTEEYYEEENNPEIIGDSSTVRTVKRSSTSTKQKKYKIKERDGQIVRDNSNSLKQYGLRILQAQVTDIDWEESFDTRLNLQKEQVAQTQLEKQEAEKEFYRTQKEIAKGEAEKAAERARLEKDQIQQTIEAETRAKVAAFKVQEEKELLSAARLSAQTVAVNADAEAIKNRKLVSAGLTPQERAEWEYKTAVGVAEQISKLNLPQVYIAGDKDKNGSSILSDLLGAEFAKSMLKK